LFEFFFWNCFLDFFREIVFFGFFFWILFYFFVHFCNFSKYFTKYTIFYVGFYVFDFWIFWHSLADQVVQFWKIFLAFGTVPTSSILMLVLGVVYFYLQFFLFFLYGSIRIFGRFFISHKKFSKHHEHHFSSRQTVNTIFRVGIIIFKKWQKVKRAERRKPVKRHRTFFQCSSSNKFKNSKKLLEWSTRIETDL